MTVFAFIGDERMNRLQRLQSSLLRNDAHIVIAVLIYAVIIIFVILHAFVLRPPNGKHRIPVVRAGGRNKRFDALTVHGAFFNLVAQRDKLVRRAGQRIILAESGFERG